MENSKIISTILNSDNPSIRYRVRTKILNENIDQKDLITLRNSIKESTLVKDLLSEKTDNGTIPHHPYSKFYGPHWILYSLAELDYPQNDINLLPIRDQIYKWIFSRKFEKHFIKLKDRVSAHTCMIGNVLYYTLKLGIAESKKTEKLVNWLIDFRWPDGGWNSDRTKKAKISSFMETVLPIKGLKLYYDQTKNNEIKQIINSALEIFLQRKLFQRLTDNSTINSDFLRLHYPCYFHYDILEGLKICEENDKLSDVRCLPALEYLKSKQDEMGFFKDDKKYYRKTDKLVSGRSVVNWNTGKFNEFITADSIYILKETNLLDL